MDSFRTHTGELVRGERLVCALNKVADDWRELAYAIRREDAYADHVSEANKNELLFRDLNFAEQIRAGRATGFTIWQRVNTELTGECIALLS